MKIECKICHKKFKRVCAHARQAHGMSAREYKKQFGYDLGRGILTDYDREYMREQTLKNGTYKNLEYGTEYRFKKGQDGLGKYERSRQTQERLKKQLLGKGNNKGQILVPKVTVNCGTCGTGFKKYPRQVGKNNYCSRHCSTIARNKAMGKSVKLST